MKPKQQKLLLKLLSDVNDAYVVWGTTGDKTAFKKLLLPSLNKINIAINKPSIKKLLK